MSTDLTRSIVRVLDSANKTCGTGFVVHAGDDSRIVTCAHVVKLAKSGPSQSIALTFFPFDLDRFAKKYSAIVEPGCWRDPDAEDIAVLHLEEPFPREVEPLHLGSSQGSEGHVFQSYGFGAAKPTDGLWGEGIVRGLTWENGFPVLQMDSSEVSLGFSGAPIWDKALQVVIGIVTSVSRPDRLGRLAGVNFVIPVETLSRVCPDLHPTDECPYRGLSTFTEQDRAVFFGREQAIEELLKKLRTNPPFLAVFGPSGSGKSSLVRAGVIPRLKEAHRPLGKDWGVIVTRPADSPFKQLSDQGLDVASDGLLGGVRGWLKLHPDKQRLLLVIDQFEELFVTCPETQRSLFIKQLTQLRNEPSATVLIVMRNDFYSQLVEHETLREWLAMSGGAMDIPQTLKRNDLMSIILKPAERYRLRFQEALPDLIMRDVMQESSHSGDEDEETAQCTVLPLLEFALSQLWEQRYQGVLASDVYRDIGGVAGGLTLWTNRVIANLGEERLPLVERVFLALVHLGDEMSRQPDSRQPATLASLTALGRNDSERAALQYVIQELVNARLLVIHGDPHRHEATVEIIHEALLRHWPALKHWIERDRDFLQWQQELERRTQAWRETNLEDVSQRDEGRLLRGRDLAVAEDMFNTRGDELTAMQHEYILASQKQMTDELEKERQRTTELSAALETAQRQRQVALARGLAAQAVLYSQYSYDPNLIERCILLAIESLRRFPSPQADQALREGGILLRWRIAALAHENKVVAVAFSPDGKLLATASYDEIASLWEVSTGKRAVTLEDMVTEVAFSPDGKLLATASHDETAKVWEVSTGKRVATMLGMRGGVSALAFSPDGKLLATASFDLATASQDKITALWEVSTGKRVATLEGAVRAVAFSPDGKLLATASHDKTARVWEVRTGKRVATLGHKDAVDAVAFSPNGRLVATASRDCTAAIWKVSSGKRVATLRHEMYVAAVAFSPDGKLLATASFDKTAKVWEVSSGRRVGTVSHRSTVLDVAFSPDGKLLATASNDGTAGVWEVSSSKRVATLPHEDIVLEVAFSPDGHLVATVSDDKTAGVWEVSSDKQVAMLPHENIVWAVAFSPDGKLLETTSDDKTAGVWEVSTGKRIGTVSHGSQVRVVAFSPDGKLLATAGYDGRAVLWEVSTGERVVTLGGGGRGEVNAVAFSPDGHLVATASDDGRAALWEVSSGRWVGMVSHGRSVWAVAFSPDGKLLATASGDKTAGVWEVSSDKQVAVLAHEDAVRVVAFSPDGKLLATASLDKTAKVWEVDSGRRVATLAHENAVWAVAFSPDGHLVATASDDKTAKVWEVSSGKQVAVLAHEDAVKAVAFSPDGRQVATASYDGTAGVWEISSGQQLVRLVHESVSVSDVAFSPDGRYLATASGNMAEIWLWRSEDLIAAVRPKLRRNLTRGEWEQFLGDEPYRKTFEDLP